MKVHFSSKKDDWETPQDLFDKQNAIHNFDIDVCATRENAKCRQFFTKEDDALEIRWGAYGSRFWMNPPYGRQIARWMKKAYEESLNGYKVVCLVPARTDTKWWHDWAMRGRIEFIKGRIKSKGAKHAAPFPSAIVIFGA